MTRYGKLDIIVKSGNGAWRSLVARFVRDEEAAGSNPVAPTIFTLDVIPRHNNTM